MQKIYLVPHTHYDVVWAFSKEEYLKINEAILEEALKMMESSRFRAKRESFQTRIASNGGCLSLARLIDVPPQISPSKMLDFGLKERGFSYGQEHVCSRADHQQAEGG